jgi:hypothetical protein
LSGNQYMQLPPPGACTNGYVTFESLVTARSADADGITRVKVTTSLRLEEWESAGRPTTLDVVLAQPDRG